MTTQTTNRKRKLLFEYISMDSPSFISTENVISQEKIKKLKQNYVKSVFIITSASVYRDPYIRLIKAYEEAGFTVKSFHIEDLDDEHLNIVRNIVKDINNSLKKGGCEIVSFGKSYAGTVIACFFVSSGKNSPEAIEKVQNINNNLITGKDEEIFIHQFQRFIRPADEPAVEKTREKEKTPEKREPVPEKAEEELKPVALDDIEEEKTTEKPVTAPPSGEPDLHKEMEMLEEAEFTQPITRVDETEEKPVIEKRKEEEKKPPAQAEEAAPAADKKPIDLKSYEDLQYGKFYQSIRFKLISIISFLIVVSISVMIFLATYFFKSDNEIRVNENNLKISEVISLKVKSDFQSIIDKSKLLANAMMQNINQKDIEKYSKLILHNDRDFLFFGLAVPDKKGGSLNFMKSAYNEPLMAETQISKNDIISAHSANTGALKKSFNGETVIHNVSPGFKQPVIGLSLPFHKTGAGNVQSILVSYIKLDKFLKAFSESGITRVFMVNENGDIIAHPDSTIVVSGGNYINLPIVKDMIKSKLDNGQTRYRDESGVYHLGSFKKIGLAGCGVIATVEEEKAFQAIYDMQRRNIYLMVIVLTSVILIIYFFAKTLTTPIVRLVAATKMIKEGDFNVDIMPTTHDEIGELTSSFIEMGHGLEEREKMKDAFGKFVNKEIAEQVLKGEIRLGGERKNAAVFFSDIRSFTAISEKLEPEEVVEFLNDYMTRMVRCVNVTNGVVDKYIGDAIMAEWGVPISTGNDTENAVNSALMMRKALMEFNNERGGERKPKIRIGCGINTGPVLAGQIGSEDRMEYTVIGDTVNLASRIEALNKPFGTDILISEDSYKIVKDVFAVETMSPIKVKGKEKPQQIYAVLGRLDDNQRPKNVEELRVLLGIEQQPFNRRWNDEEPDEMAQEEVKYEILEQRNK